MNFKTVNFEKYLGYIKIRNEIVQYLYKFYENELFRTLELKRYINTKKSEQKMIQNFKKKFGKPNETIIAFGDYNKTNLKYHEPTKGKSFRSLLRSFGYKVYLVNESFTSKRCSYCKNKDSDCNIFHLINNPRPWKNNEIICHGLVTEQ